MNREEIIIMMKSIKTWVLVVLASSLLVACGQGGGGSGKNLKL